MDIKNDYNVEVWGVIFHGVKEIIEYAMLHKPKDGVYVAFDRKFYPCFDSFDYECENRYFWNFIFTRSKKALYRRLKRLKAKRSFYNHCKLSRRSGATIYFGGDEESPLETSGHQIKVSKDQSKINIFDHIRELNIPGDSDERRLYNYLCFGYFGTCPYKRDKLWDDMTLVCQVMNGHYMPRFLMNGNTQLAYEFTKEDGTLAHVTKNDVVWSSIEGTPYEKTVRELKGCYPMIFGFSDGVSLVYWKIKPEATNPLNGGKTAETESEEITLYGVMDASCEMLIPFQLIDDKSKLDQLGEQAKQILQSRSINH